jgi:predicted negative regulator of RcsB-dependent stress response
LCPAEWNGWALYRKGDTTKAIESWRKALKVHPGHQDALYALNFVGATP